MKTECLDKRIPWLTWRAIEQARIIGQGLNNVLEWGAGGSTLFWLDAGLSVVTIDHSARWLQEVSNRVQPGANWTSHMVNTSSVGTIRSRRANGFFDAYVNAGLEAERKRGRFDIVCVDGRARNDCATVARLIAKYYVILDNSDRADYAPAIEEFNRPDEVWTRQDYAGPGPQSSGVKWQTTFFRRQ